MAKMGLYCKAYPIERFQEFSKWNEHAKPIPPVNQSDAGSASAEETALRERILFLQENFVVTASIFIDEQIVFDEVTDEWKDFCLNVLEFKVPEQDATPQSAAV